MHHTEGEQIAAADTGDMTSADCEVWSHNQQAVETEVFSSPADNPHGSGPRSRRPSNFMTRWRRRASDNQSPFSPMPLHSPASSEQLSSPAVARDGTPRV